MIKRKLLNETLGVMIILGIMLGLPTAIFMFRDRASLPQVSAADAVIILAGRNDGLAGKDGSWIVEYSNVPVRRDKEGIPLIYVRQGQRVHFRITGKDVSHGLAIKEYGIDVVVHPGTYEDVSFVADKTGKFTAECSIFCGLGHHGMVAKLIVKK